jgi:uncharacterized protein with GYD domain
MPFRTPCHVDDTVQSHHLTYAAFSELLGANHEGEAIMATFMLFLQWTEQGVRNVKDFGNRHQSARAAAEKLGGRIVSTYLTTGEYDVVATVDMPNGEAMSQLALSIAASGNARTTTVRAYSVDEFAKLASGIPTFS